MKGAQLAVVGRARIPKSREGRPKVAHGFNRGLRMENGQSPGRRRAEAALWRAAKAGGATEKMGLDRCVLSSLTGLVLCSRHNPAINRWAIFERPCGTWNRDTLNTYKARKTTLTQSLRDCYIGSVTSVCPNTCQPEARIVSLFVGNGIERDAPALGERRPQLFFWGAAIVGRAVGRKRRCEQPPPRRPRRDNFQDRR